MPNFYRPEIFIPHVWMQNRQDYKQLHLKAWHYYVQLEIHFNNIDNTQVISFVWVFFCVTCCVILMWCSMQEPQINILLSFCLPPMLHLHTVSLHQYATKQSWLMISACGVCIYVHEWEVYPCLRGDNHVVYIMY